MTIVTMGMMIKTAMFVSMFTVIINIHTAMLAATAINPMSIPASPPCHPLHVRMGLAISESDYGGHRDRPYEVQDDGADQTTALNLLEDYRCV